MNPFILEGLALYGATATDEGEIISPLNKRTGIRAYTSQGRLYFVEATNQRKVYRSSIITKNNVAFFVESHFGWVKVCD